MTQSASLATAFIVTIDGPAASGKSSVSRELAHLFGWQWLSTGMFYRGIAYIAHSKGVDLSDESALVKLIETADWAVRMTPLETRVILEGRDITDDVSREEVGSLASKISSLPKVRQALLNAQRQSADGLKGLVAEGRDCGSVVFPNAKVKVFLTARAEDRAARRAKDEGRHVDHLIAEQKRRDAQDTARKTAPLLAAPDSHTIDTTDLTLTEVVRKVEALVRHALPN